MPSIMINVTDSTNAKGTTPKFVHGSDNTCSGHRCGMFRRRKLSRLLGRIREANCHRSKGGPYLQANIWRTWPSDLPWKSWRDAEHDVHNALKEELHRCKVESFQSWRSHMAKEGREVTNWLKQKHFRVAPLISDAEGSATTASQSVSKLWVLEPQTLKEILRPLKTSGFKQNSMPAVSEIPRKMPYTCHRKLLYEDFVSSFLQIYLEGPAAAVAILPNLICYCSIATVACIWYIDFLTPHTHCLFGVSCRSNSEFWQARWLWVVQGVKCKLVFGLADL